MLDIVIVGGGASIKAFEPRIWDDLDGCMVMSVNHAYRFMRHPPLWQVSIDKKFWKQNEKEMDRLADAGCEMVNRDFSCTMSKEWRIDRYYCGSRKLSGVFALSWTLRAIRPERVFLFGYDFGPVGGRTHFYDEPKHSGMGKERAYMEGGKVLPAVQDFDNFKGMAEIYIVGPTNITSFPVIPYGGFLERIGRI
jgi:hypothetical protein